MERVYIDGKIVPPEEAKVSVLDRSFLFGDSVYETLRTYGGKLFSFDQHMARLQHSAAQLRLNIPGVVEIQRRCNETLEAAENEDSYCRIIVSRGEGTFGLLGGLDAPGRLIILVRPFVPLERALYDNGVHFIISKTRRNPPEALDPSIKSGNYLNNIFAALEARDVGAFDAILLNTRGNVAEGTTSTVFCVRDGALWTPPLSAGILAGVTRRLTLEVARAEGLDVFEENFDADALRSAAEAFITSTMKQILPVVKIDGTVLGAGKPGPVTRHLMTALAAEIDAITAKVE